jgi:uroporphyrin-III C-methyltransferase/precorrin-2 dehydrogenase/sirohydrochlorin ferrochelatase
MAVDTKVGAKDLDSEIAGGSLFPVFLRLANRRVVVVGGGRVAAGKITGLVATNARITVVAPEVRPEITAVPGIVIALRPFAESDLDGAWLVIAAAPPSVNDQVASAAEVRAIFVNAVDDRDHGSAFTGGVFRRGGVTIAVSTEGRAPALAGLLREGLEALVPEEIETWVVAAQSLRERQRAQGIAMGERRPRLLQALNQLYENHRAES